MIADQIATLLKIYERLSPPLEAGLSPPASISDIRNAENELEVELLVELRRDVPCVVGCWLAVQLGSRFRGEPPVDRRDETGIIRRVGRDSIGGLQVAMLDQQCR